MRGLLLRLSALDPGAESAVRIIAFFDGLTKNRATTEALVRAAAGLADCPIGIRDNAGAVLAYFDPRGRPVMTPPATVGLVERSYGNSTSGGTIWLERADGAEALDEILLERMSVAAEIILDRRRSAPGPLRDDPQLVRTLVNARSRETDRTEAARAMGLTGDVMVLAVRLATPDAQRLLRLTQSVEHDMGRPVRGAVIDDNAAAVVVDAASTELLDKILDEALATSEFAGVGSRRRPLDAHLSWRTANQALVFAVAAGKRVVRGEQLGPVALLASLPRTDLAEEPDVAALIELARTRGGSDVLATLELLTETGSLRRVSVAMHMHHSSIAHRIRRAEAALGYALDDQAGLFRARLAVEMWRIAGFDRQVSPESGAHLAE